MRASGRAPSAARSSSLLLLVAIASAVLLAAAGAGPTAPGPGATVRASTASAPRPSTASGLYFDYVVIILMENQNICGILTTCGGAAPYLTSLAATYGLASNEMYCNVNPSLPNYLCLSGASDFGCAGYDGDPNSNACTAAAWAAPNIVDRLVSGGLTWKAYMEDMPSNCYSTDSGNYAVRHDPFVYYSDNKGDASRCARIVPAGPSAGSDATFLGDLGSTSTASNYMWFTPNTCNDMHDCTVAQGDAYLGSLVPQILNSTVFTTQRAAVFITFDEGYGHPAYTAWAGSVVKKGFTSAAAYTHFSLLKTIEENWNLANLTANDGGAAGMGEFFGSAGPDFGLTADPGSVSFAPGGNATATVHLASLRGFNGTVTLTATSSPAGVTATCAPTTLHGSEATTCKLAADAQGDYVVTVRGMNGSLVHTAMISVSVANPPFLGPYGMLIIAGVIILAIGAVFVLLLRRGKKRSPRAP